MTEPEAPSIVDRLDALADELELYLADIRDMAREMRDEGDEEDPDA